MSVSYSSIQPRTLFDRLISAAAPRVLDLRADLDAFGGRWIPGALRAGPDGGEAALAAAGRAVVLCGDAPDTARLTAPSGVEVALLAGGMAGWIEAGLPTVKPPGGMRPWRDPPTRWITRERPRIDRVACPWLIRRFIDPDADIHYVAANAVEAEARHTGAVPFDIKGVRFGHVGDRCSFDAFIEAYGIADPVLDAVARIVRGADTGWPDLTPQCHGLLAISSGLTAVFADDQSLLAHGTLMYDALYAWQRGECEKSGGHGKTG